MPNKRRRLKYLKCFTISITAQAELQCNVLQPSLLVLLPLRGHPCALPPTGARRAPRRSRVAFRTRSAGISHCTSRTGFHIDEQLGTRAKPPPSLGYTGCCNPLSGTKFASEQHKALSAAGGYNQSDPSLPASRQVLDQRTGSLCRPPTQTAPIPWYHVVASPRAVSLAKAIFA